MITSDEQYRSIISFYYVFSLRLEPGHHLRQLFWTQTLFYGLQHLSVCENVLWLLHCEKMYNCQHLLKRILLLRTFRKILYTSIRTFLKYASIATLNCETGPFVTASNDRNSPLKVLWCSLMFYLFIKLKWGRLEFSLLKESSEVGWCFTCKFQWGRGMFNYRKRRQWL